MEYKEVPYIISTKDLDYLTDAFNWHYGAYKNGLDALNNICNEDLKKDVKAFNKAIYDMMSDILNVLEGEINENS